MQKCQGKIFKHRTQVTHPLKVNATLQNSNDSQMTCLSSTTHIWHKPLVSLTKTRAIIAKASHTSKGYQILDFSEEKGQINMVSETVWHVYNNQLETTTSFIFSPINKVLTNFNIWVDDGPHGWKNLKHFRVNKY